MSQGLDFKTYIGVRRFQKASDDAFAGARTKLTPMMAQHGIGLAELRNVVAGRAQFAKASPPGWGGTVEAMKEHHPEIDNPFALAWHLKKRGAHPHIREKKAKKKLQDGEAAEKSFGAYVQRVGQPSRRAEPVRPMLGFMRKGGPRIVTGGDHYAYGGGAIPSTRKTEGATKQQFLDHLAQFPEVQRKRVKTASNTVESYWHEKKQVASVVRPHPMSGGPTTYTLFHHD